MNWFRSKAQAKAEKLKTSEREVMRTQMLNEAKNLEVYFIEYLDLAADFAAKQPNEEHKKIIADYVARTGELLQLFFALVKDSKSFGFLQLLKLRGEMAKAQSASVKFDASLNQFVRDPIFEEKSLELKNRLDRFLTNIVSERAKGG